MLVHTFVMSLGASYAHQNEIACVIAESVKNMEHKLIKPKKTSESEKYIAGAFYAVSLGVTHFYGKLINTLVKTPLNT